MDAIRSHFFEGAAGAILWLGILTSRRLNYWWYDEISELYAFKPEEED